MKPEKMFVVDDTISGNVKVSPHFRVREFKCNDNTRITFVSDELLSVLENVRNHFGQKIHINSGYRTVSYNSTIKNSSPKSQHTYGRAADIVVEGFRPIEVYNYINATWPTKYGLGIYNTFVHIDVRPGKSRWDSRTNKES